MKQGTRKATCLLLAFLLLGGSLTGFAEGMDAFTRQRTYIEGTFTDIGENDWFYHEVVNAYEYGLANGAGDAKFLPYDLVSVAEVVAFAARIHSVYAGDHASFSAADGAAWYEPYVDYAVEQGLIGAEEFSALLEKPATRAQTAYILAGSLPFTEFSNINPGIESLPDVTADDAYYNEIIMLYRAGVLSGKDAYGTFSPKENVTRAETAATMNRIVDKDERRTFTLSALPTDGGSYDTTPYDAVAISDRAGPSVFYIEIYDKNQRALGSGSGFFIDSDGTAVTNFHVIEEAYYAKVKTVDGGVYNVTSVLGYDAANDLAVLKVEGSGFPYLELADSDGVKNGQKIFCVGSPLGLENTISEGLVSNASRTINGEEYIQITAPISAGSSGGAVLDTNCRVVGVSCGGIESGQSINLAVPSNKIGAIARDKNLSLYDMQVAGTQTAAPVYTDNRNVPDYGAVAGIAALRSNYDSLTGIMTHTYAYESGALLRYMQVLQESGYVLREQQSTNRALNLVYLSGNTVVGIHADLSGGAVNVLYYPE